jgi:rifampicin phosphotransferase
MREGTLKAFETLKLPIKQFYTKIEDGYLYQCALPFEGDHQDRLNQHKQAVQERFPILMDIYQGYVTTEFLPFYTKIDNWRRSPLTLVEAAKCLEELHAFYIRAWELHFEIVMPRSSLGLALEQHYCQLAKTSHTTVVYEWLVGVMNKSLETDRELWKLAKLAGESLAIRQILEDTPLEKIELELSTLSEGKVFLETLHSFLEEYGYRSTNAHEFIVETWVENSGPALAVISRFVKESYDFDKAFNLLVTQRKSSFEAVLQKLPEGELKQTFLQLYEFALKCSGLDEDHHFYIDAMLPSKSRLFLLKIGNMLVAEGVTQQPEDVFFFYLDELLSVLRTPLPSIKLVANRKKEYQQNKTKQPAPTYGQPPETTAADLMAERIFGIRLPDVEAQIFKGYAASHGIYTGKVKVVQSPNGFAKIQKGEILVCKTTTPAWTVLFSLVGAIITDAGGILSHAGTVAREYQLPAVLGTKVATSLLRDGQFVTVDGTQGLVTIHE